MCSDLSDINVLHRFQFLAGRPLQSHECLYAEIDLTQPFNMLFIAADTDRLSIHGLIEFFPVEESYPLTHERATTLRNAITAFPSDLIDYREPGHEIFGGSLIAAVSEGEPERRLVSTTILDFVIPRLQTWGYELLRLLRRIVAAESIIMDRKRSFGWVGDD